MKTLGAFLTLARVEEVATWQDCHTVRGSDGQIGAKAMMAYLKSLQ